MLSRDGLGTIGWGVSMAGQQSMISRRERLFSENTATGCFFPFVSFFFSISKGEPPGNAPRRFSCHGNKRVGCFKSYCRKEGHSPCFVLPQPVVFCGGLRELFKYSGWDLISSELHRRSRYTGLLWICYPHVSVLAFFSLIQYRSKLYIFNQ